MFLFFDRYGEVEKTAASEETRLHTFQDTARRASLHEGVNCACSGIAYALPVLNRNQATIQLTSPASHEADDSSRRSWLSLR